MFNKLFKSVLFGVLISPLAALAMEPLPDKIEMGKELAIAADRRDWTTRDWTTVENLIAQGADLNQRDAFEWTPLMNAVRSGHEKLAQLLIAGKADLNLKNLYGSTALTIAVNYGRGNVFFHMLIDAMLAQNQQVYAFLFCLKQIPGFKNTNLPRDLFKPFLLPMLTDVRQEINRISNLEIRNQLLEKYGLRPISNSEAQ